MTLRGVKSNKGREGLLLQNFSRCAIVKRLYGRRCDD